MIACMQGFGGVFAECTNLLHLIGVNSVPMAVSFFVAFHALHVIDNIFVEACGAL